MNGPNEPSSQGVSGRVHCGSLQVPAAETPALNHLGGAILLACRKSAGGAVERWGVGVDRTGQEETSHKV